MKGDVCMVPIREVVPRGGGLPWLVALVGVSLFAGAAIVLVVFTTRALREVGELREEVARLKEAVLVLDELKTELPLYRPNTTTFLAKEEVPKGGSLVFGDYYDNDDYYINLESYESYDDEVNEDLASTSRDKRSVIGYSQDTTNNEDYSDNKKRNQTFEKHTTMSNYNPYYVDSDDSPTGQPRTLHSRRLRIRNEEHPDVEFVSHPRHRQRHLEIDEPNFRTGRMKPLPVAQFVGDTSRFVFGQHENFNGNGHLKHPQRTFVDWAESRWFRTLGMDQHFCMNDGILTIKDPGLYFIYAQIYYLDEHDINGFRVYKNENETVLQCTTMTHTMHRVWKGNTCFTAGVEYLEENDKISVGDLSESRYSLFEPGKSFFGVIKLGDVKIK